MEYDEKKIADTVLALLVLTLHDESENGGRAWKGHDWSVLEALHERGDIGDPKNKNKSIYLTTQGLERAKKLFDEMFTKPKDG